MATNPLIALQVRTPDVVGGFQRGRLQALQEQQAEQQAGRQNRLLDLQEQQFAGQQQNAGLQRQATQLQISGEQRRQMGAAAAETAMALDPLIQAGDFQGALQLLDTNYAGMARNGLQAPDPVGLRDALRAGDANAAKQLTSGIINRARQLGFIEREPKAAALPDEAQLFQFRAGLNPQQQAQFDGFMASQQRSAGGGQPYFTPLQTSTGLYSFDNRRGSIEALAGDQGAQLLPVAIDPAAQAAVTGAKEAAKVTSKAGAQAVVDLPQTLATAEQTLSLIDQALAHPGRATATGMSGRIDPRNYAPGTDATDFQVLMDQIGGRAFLQAFESLKGGGQITEVEGRKATEAIGRLNRAQSDDEFVKSLQELRDIAVAAAVRARDKAAAAQQQQPAAAPAPAPAAPAGPARVGRFMVEAAD